MIDRIQIACNIDAGYVKYCSVMLLSLFENNKDSSFDIHIITDKLPEEGERILTSVVKQYDNNIFFYYINDNYIVDFPEFTSKHISKAAYYRCFIDSILPLSISKVLYLDSDMIIVNSIKELWDTDITQYSLAAVEDMWSNEDSYYLRLGYSKEYSYFNSGVLLLNLTYLRNHNTKQLVNEYIAEYYDQLVFNDQDVFNGLFHETKLFIPFRWNMQDGFYRTRRKIRREVWTEIDEAIKSPSIIHFTGGKKPWQYESIHPLKQKYYQYLDKSIWKGERPRPILKKMLEFKINIFLGKLKLLRPKYRKV